MLFKRKETWYYKFSVKGKVIYRSTGTHDKEQARAIEAKAYSEALNTVKTDQKPRYSWQDAVIRWLNESENKSIETEKYHLRWLSKHLDDMDLNDITHDVIEGIIKEKLKETGTTRCNRTTSIIGAILNKACKKWGWIDNTPYIRKFKESNQRLRWLTHEEAERLLPELLPHAQAMMLFTLVTGLRESNVTGLEWSQVDMQNKVAWIHADQSKNDKPIRVPLTQDALSILRNQIGEHNKMVFAYKGKPILKASTLAWRKALERAGIKDFCWHGLRHTWASWHIQAGTPLNVLQELGGWSDHKMVLRYAHLAPEHLSEYANRLPSIVAKTVASEKVTRIKNL
ncbi:MAG: site-specific integrase [Methylococcaceae bacterium]